MTEPLTLDYQRLDRLALRFRGGLGGFHSGKRPTRKFGSSLEFADYRPYLPGDDIRRIDWSLYGRSRRLYSKLNRSEVDATVNLVIDDSSSMDWGRPHKGRRALQLALALAYVSLMSYDRVAVGLGKKKLDRYLPPLYGKGSFGRVLRFLEEQEFAGEGDLNTLLRSFYRVLKPGQITVVVSDFLSPGGYSDGLSRLIAARQELLVVHVASPDELAPDYRGPLTLIDIETGRKKDIEADPWLLQHYRRTFHRYSSELETFCSRREIKYFLYDSGRDAVDFLLEIAPLILKRL